jgi:bacillithiol biosynthesis deacetylase BshB1
MMVPQKVSILAFAAHADDLEISCGGTLARAAARGQRVGMVDLTRGEMGTRGTPAVRRRESLRAQKSLGAKFRLTLDFGDGNLRTGRDEELELIRIIRDHRPEIVIAPWPDERHPDHTRAGRLVTEAAFYAGLKTLDTGQDAHRPQTVVYYLQNFLLPPTFIVDVSESFKAKLKALSAYKSQFHNPNSKEPPTLIASKAFSDMIEARARHYGYMIGAEYGEAFVTKQPPTVNDIVAAYRGREVQ